MAKILAFSGSARVASYNQKLVAIAAAGAQSAGAQVSLVSLADYPMPIYNQDLEAAEGLPESTRLFKQLLLAHDGFLIASPEYNSAFSPLLKNTLDWCSRKQNEEQALLAYRGKTAAIMSTSPGALGGLRGLVFLRLLLSNMGVTVLANQQAIGMSAQAFSEQGRLVDDNLQAAIFTIGVELATTLDKLQQ
ncbi:MAG: NAD(P)H-dependent oxidoreductase [Methylococcaceae bacterium]|jgi:NAD(P)H-dependent FMN reductase